jgi:hypothetical protein
VEKTHQIVMEVLKHIFYLIENMSCWGYMMPLMAYEVIGMLEWNTICVHLGFIGLQFEGQTSTGTCRVK